MAAKSRTSDADSSEGEETSSPGGKKVVFKSVMARNIYRQLFELQLPKTNELFQPNRMAYIVDLNDEETDVPITSIRSKADCPNMEVSWAKFKWAFFWKICSSLYYFLRVY